MIVFLVIASLLTFAGYGNGKYYKSCKENNFKGKQCEQAKKFSKIKK